MGVLQQAVVDILPRALSTARDRRRAQHHRLLCGRDCSGLETFAAICLATAVLVVAQAQARLACLVHDLAAMSHSPVLAVRVVHADGVVRAPVAVALELGVEALRIKLRVATPLALRTELARVLLERALHRLARACAQEAALSLARVLARDTATRAHHRYYTMARAKARVARGRAAAPCAPLADDAIHRMRHARTLSQLARSPIARGARLAALLAALRLVLAARA